MRTSLRIGLALLAALALSTTAVAQTADGVMPGDVTFNALVGPSFANLGTTFSTSAGVNVRLDDRVSLVGEFGLLPRAPFDDATEIVPPALRDDAVRVNAYHWNGNLRVQPFEFGSVEPYVTAGVGSFTADTVGDVRTVNGLSIQDRRRVSDFATNAGAGLSYWLSGWMAFTADYRTFFVHRVGDDPRVHRFTTGLAFHLR